MFTFILQMRIRDTWISPITHFFTRLSRTIRCCFTCKVPFWETALGVFAPPWRCSWTILNAQTESFPLLQDFLSWIRAPLGENFDRMQNTITKDSLILKIQEILIISTIIRWIAIPVCVLTVIFMLFLMNDICLNYWKKLIQSFRFGNNSSPWFRRGLPFRFWRIRAWRSFFIRIRLFYIRMNWLRRRRRNLVELQV